MFDAASQSFYKRNVFNCQPFRQFYRQLECIGIVFSANVQLVIHSQFLELGNNRFYLGREYVDAADDQHVISTSEHSTHTHCRSSARTLVSHKITDVTSPVSDHRHAFLAQRRDDQFAFLAIRQHFQRIRVDDFYIEVVFLYVHPCIFLTAHGHSRTHDFRKSVNIISADTQTLFDLVAHALRPRLCAEYSCRKIQFFRFDPSLLHTFRDSQCIGRCAAKDIALHIL